MSAVASPRRHVLLPWTVQEREDPVLVCDRAEGVYFWDRQGKRYLDFLSQLFNCNLGHGNRRVIEAIQRQADKVCCVSPQLLTEERIALSAALAERTPGDLNTCFFVNSGSEADDQAFILARLVTGRPKIFSKYRSYHGTTFGTLGVGGDPRRAAIEPGPPGTVRFFDPYCYRCDFNLRYPECRLHCLDALERQLQLENPATVAAIVVEPVTGAAGGFPLPDGYLTRLRQLCDRYGILLIADEVITGFGRTGAWFGVDHEGIVPDMMVFAKGLTSGYVPMGAVVVNDRIAQHFQTRMLPLGSTYAAHPLACAAAFACLEEYDRLQLIPNAQRMGALLRDRLRELANRHPCVGDVRGQGLLWCLELVQDRDSKAPLVPPNTDSLLPLHIRRRAWDEGIHLMARGSLILLAPPLIITAEQVQEGVEKLDRVLSWVDAQR
ncbi:MAG: aminotransferase class III-fold pyridoxal phosphate-dependent enzyme [Gemmataceae bacterium]|nr:aminotransferase class III-fold pyridoxal phosphate-dependent enzyme [Gemmataceae bacterium]MDW8264916.1 aminotransferase class III-fold pyridoxal phosphate-dependent enzyme [Gemmataceae bacterium]